MRRRAACNGERGAAAVEFALVLPLLILLIFGIVAFSIAYNNKQALHAAAREGARLASLPTTTETEIEDRVTSSLEGVVTSSTPIIAIDPDIDQPCLDRTGETVEVSVSADVNVNIPLWPGSSTVTMTGKGEFRCE
jgi:Flp pilus assembly protein TadG